MADNFVGKSVQFLKLYTTTSGNSSNIKVVTAKTNDLNSRFIHVKLYDSRGQIECSDCNVRANYKMPDETKYSFFGDLIDSEIYIKLPIDILKEAGQVSAEVIVTKRLDEITAAVGDSRGILDAFVISDTAFMNQIEQGGIYIFMFNGERWEYNGSAINNLDEFGIAYDGEPVKGDTIIINYDAFMSLTSETFYIIVQGYEDTELILANNDVNLYVLKNELENAIAKAEEDSKKADELLETARTNMTKIDEALSEFQNIKTKFAEITSQFNSINSEWGTMKEEFSTIKNDFQGITTEFNSIKELVGNLQGEIGDLSTTLDAINGEVI